jgi:hypothetical protein
MIGCRRPTIHESIPRMMAGTRFPTLGNHPDASQLPRPRRFVILVVEPMVDE